MVAVVASLVAAGSVALPWVRSGRRDRSGFDLATTVELLDLDRGPARWAVAVWWFIPALACAALLALVLGRPRLAAGLAVAVALAVVIGAVLTARAPLALRYGRTVALVAGVTALVTGLAGLGLGSSGTSGRRSASQ